MNYMFESAIFNKNLSDWKPISVIEMNSTFLDCPIKEPYWSKIADNERRNIAIENYWLKKELDVDLEKNSNLSKKIKV
jgi:hypothetical protein